jgi:hypothetical protein
MLSFYAVADDGRCGSAAGKSFGSAPTSRLCAAGTPSTVAGSGTSGSPWTWTCSGTNGGNNPTCSATALPPAITSLSPTSGTIGTTVTINGKYFGATQGTVSFNNTGAAVSSWSDTSITCTVPKGATTGPVVVTNEVGPSKGKNFKVPLPAITSLSPTSGTIGTTVTINGKYFGATQGTVSFNNTGAAVSSWSDTSITCTVPKGATTGPVVVTNEVGPSKGKNFTVRAANLTGVAAAGPITGTVAVYKFASNTKGDLLTSGIVTDGIYSLDIGSYRSAILVEVTGAYKDEASADDKTLASPLHAVISEVAGGKVQIAVTPFTEIAYRLVADKGLTIDDANAVVGYMLRINPITTMPTDVTEATAVGLGSVDEIEYGLALAALSQMMISDPDAIIHIVDDLSNDGSGRYQLQDTGPTLIGALDTFLAGPYNQSGISDSSETRLAASLEAFAASPYVVGDNAGDVAKAKSLVADLRNTALSIYNYQGIGIDGIVETPAARAGEELTTKIEPELTNTFERIGWIIELIGYSPGGTGTWTDLPLPFPEGGSGYTVDITVSEDSKTGTFVVKQGIEKIEIDSGTITVNDPTRPTSGTIVANMQTASGNMAVDVSYSATVSSGKYTSMTLTGCMTAPGISFDFSESGRKLYATFAQQPGETGAAYLYPTKITFDGKLKTDTVQFDGSLNIDKMVWNTVCSTALPKHATFTGIFQELNNGSGTGVQFQGTMTGQLDNASSYNCDGDTTPTNFPTWTASFNGTIQAPSRPTINAFLSAKQSAYNQYTLSVSYTRTNPDSTVVSLSGSGAYNDTSQVLTATLTNQAGLVVAISYDETGGLTGTIKTSGGQKLADIYDQNGVPIVKYADDYLESIL